MSKVTLKIGDILCVDPSLIKDEDMKIIGFKNDKVLLNHIYMRETAFYQIDDTKHLISHFRGDYYYVNGIKYDKEDIIVPNPEENTQPITKDNIKEVLDFNNITDISVHTNSLGKKHCFSLSMKSDNCLDILEAIVGKLKPLPKIPEFDFEQYLLDNGFKKTKGEDVIILKYSSAILLYKSESLTGNHWAYQEKHIQETLKNADILIKMANLAKDLK